MLIFPVSTAMAGVATEKKFNLVSTFLQSRYFWFLHMFDVTCTMQMLSANLARSSLLLEIQ